MAILRGLATAILAVAVIAVGGPAVAATAVPAATSGSGYTWTGAGDDTSWGDADNWAPVGVPTDGDAVAVQAPDDDLCHAHVTGVPADLTLTDLTIDEHLFHGDPDSPCLTSISGGSITVTHHLTFHAGVIDTPVTVASGATATVTPGAAHDTTQFSQAVTVDGALDLTDNSGDEYLSLTDSPGITVDNGATLTTQGVNRIYADCCNDPAHLTNNGTVQLHGTTTLDSVELDQNSLLNATGGARILTDFAPQTAGAGARWTGTGAWLLGYSSTTTVTGKQALGSNFSWQFGGNGSSAEEYLRGTFSLGGTGRFAWGGGVIAAAMTVGTGVAFVADGADGPDTRYLDGVGTGAQHVALTNLGAMAFSGGAGWYGRNGAQLTNASTGVLTLGAGTAVGADCCTNPASLVNSGGQVLVPAGAGTVTVDETGYRARGGTLDVGAGSDLELTGGASGSLSTTTISGGGSVGLAQPITTSGTETVGAGATVRLEKYGSLTSSVAATVGGAGTFAWTGGSVAGVLTFSTATGQTISGTAETKHIVATSGGSASTVTFSGPTTVAAGKASTPDTLQSDPGTALRFSGALSLAAGTRLSGGAITTTGATTVAASTGSASVTGNATLTNSGKLTVNTGTLASDPDIVQTGGSTTVKSGAVLRFAGSSSLRAKGGTIAGSGQVAGNVTVGNGTLSPGTAGTGTLTVSGTLTTTTASTLLVDLGSTAHDQLVVGGGAILHGTLRLTDLAGYQPATGDTVAVVTAGSLTAGFSCVTTGGDGGATQHWTAKAVGSDLRLTSRPGAVTSC